MCLLSDKHSTKGKKAVRLYYKLISQNCYKTVGMSRNNSIERISGQESIRCNNKSQMKVLMIILTK